MILNFLLEKITTDGVADWIGESSFGKIRLCHEILKQLRGTKGEEIVLEVSNDNRKGFSPVRLYCTGGCWRWAFLKRKITVNGCSDYCFGMSELVLDNIIHALFPMQNMRDCTVWIKITPTQKSVDTSANS